ncbi:MAG: PD40 domain-containing protein [Anaerolineaceae bacterium]|nr:PD40 domain-containing protein [Anaerolineaceae bacterium]
MTEKNINSKYSFFFIFALILFNILLLSFTIFPDWIKSDSISLLNLRNSANNEENQIPDPLPTSTNQVSQIINPSSEFDTYLDFSLLDDLIIFSMSDGNHKHLFVYHPQFLPLSKLTNSDWDDISPRMSPDGTTLAFSSRMNGNWDIYLWNLLSDELTQLTNSKEYDAYPTWSPDGQWLAFETYIDNNIEIIIKSTSDQPSEYIRLTDHPGADFSPAWSPNGREIAFVSNRNGDNEIWVAQLDQENNRLSNISNNSESQDLNPSWSRDGNNLIWSSSSSGNPQVNLLSSGNGNIEEFQSNLFTGSNPVFNPISEYLLTEIKQPNSTTLAVYNVSSGVFNYPPLHIPGSIYGIDWAPIQDITTIEKKITNSFENKKRLWEPLIEIDPEINTNRNSVIKIENVIAPYPYLHDNVNESFNALKNQSEIEIGWNFLDTMENLYIPLTEPPKPSIAQDWLYTGRAFSINPTPIQASWMVIQKENYYGQIFWRIHLKARYQDGTQGMPLYFATWDMAARFSGDTQSFENGGKVGDIPEGYWVDFTEIAARFDWERIPALSNWRSFIDGTRFNYFVIKDHLNWNLAMQQLYPSEALATATRLPTKTITPSPTAYQSPTPSPTYTETPVPSITPTLGTEE